MNVLLNYAFERDTVEQIQIHVLPTDRFKTFAISVYIGIPLSERQVTATALAPFVLRRGTAKFPETKQFRERLDDLYGAGFGFDIYKRGDYQMVQVRMDVINDQFVSQEKNNSLLKQSIDFIGDTLTNPVLEHARFRSKYVDSEKETLQKRLEAIINDKIRYAAERCIQEMCVDEPYRLNPLGKIEDLEQITAESLYSQYQSWIEKAPMDIYVVGKTSLKEVKALVEQAFHVHRHPAYSYELKASSPKNSRARTVVERLDVKQGKLNMGLRTGIIHGDRLYPASLMYNGILGGYPHSKLFTNVRERASLAYYASSRLDGFKGIITLQSGIEMAHYEQTVEIIKQQLDAMKAGEYSALELTQTRAMLSNSLREIQDSAFEMISFDFSNVLTGGERTVQGMLEAIQGVSPDEIRQVAEQVELDTVYFLRDLEGSNVNDESNPISAS